MNHTHTTHASSVAVFTSFQTSLSDAHLHDVHPLSPFPLVSPSHPHFFHTFAAPGCGGCAGGPCPSAPSPSASPNDLTMVRRCSYRCSPSRCCRRTLSLASRSSTRRLDTPPSTPSSLDFTRPNSRANDWVVSSSRMAPCECCSWDRDTLCCSSSRSPCTDRMHQEIELWWLGGGSGAAPQLTRQARTVRWDWSFLTSSLQRESIPSRSDTEFLSSVATQHAASRESPSASLEIPSLWDVYRPTIAPCESTATSTRAMKLWAHLLPVPRCAAVPPPPPPSPY